MVNWRSLNPEQIVDYCTEYQRRWSEYPSIREIFYGFIDLLWPNTKSSYSGLVKWLRNKRLTGEINWRFIRDGSGRRIDTGDHYEWSTDDFIDGTIQGFKDSWERYHLPRWKDQPNKVVILTEKEADYPVIQSIVRDLNVDTGYLRGYTGWRLLFQLRRNFEEEGKTPKIIVIGDLDPSGEDLTRFIADAMARLGVSDVTVEKVAVTREQVSHFTLPHRPEDEEEMAKLQRDPRYRSWPYGLYRVETAALRTRQPDYFRDVIRDAVEQHFDQNIYRRVQRIEGRRRRQVRERIETLSARLDEE